MEDFLQDLARRGCRFWLENGSLRMSAPAGVVTAELKEELRARKDAIVTFLARAPERSNAPAARLEPRAPGENVPLLRGQKRILELSASQKNASAYNVPMAFSIEGPLDAGAMKQALLAIEARHEALRTVFAEDRQVVAPAGSWDGFCVVEAATPAALEEGLRQAASRPFDVARGPLWRVMLLRTSPDAHVLCAVFHHAIFDGFSRAVFLRELAAFHDAATSGATPQGIRPLKVQTGDFALWSARACGAEALKRDMEHWGRQFPDPVPELALPAPRQAPGAEATTVSQRLVLPETTARRLLEEARARGILPAAMLLAAAALLLHRHTGQSDLLFCVPLTNRPQPELEDLIGYFNSVVPLRLRLDRDASQGALADEAHRLILDASGHQNADLQDIAALPALARTPLNRAMVSVQETRSAPFGLKGLTVTPRALSKESADFDLALQFEISGGTIAVAIECNAARFDAVARARLAERLQEVTASLAGEPGRAIAALPGYGVAPEDIAALLEADARVDAAHAERDAASGMTTAWMKLNEDRHAALADIRAMLATHLEPWQVPGLLVPVDDLPRTADGAVDAGRLRTLASARRRGDAGRRAPRNDLERTIAAIWQEVLWLDHPLGPDDRFHDLGGHSLLAVRMIATLETRLGHPLPGAALRQLTTLGAFAEAIARGETATSEKDETRPRDPSVIGPKVVHRLQTYTASWEGWRLTPDSLVVGKNVEGRRTPLFWCLQNYNELCQLAKYMGPDQPVYGMRSGNHVMVKSQANIDRLAAFYAAEIAQIVPPGRLLVGGNCQAAQIAFQIACRLLERGYEIPLLYLHEKFIPMPYAGRVALSFGRESTRNPYLTNDHPEEEYARCYSGPMTVDLVSGSHAQFFREPNVQDLIRVLKKHRDACLPEEA